MTPWSRGSRTGPGGMAAARKPISSARTIKQIAAIALLHDFTVGTRTIDDFAGCGVRRRNPFQAV